MNAVSKPRPRRPGIFYRSMMGFIGLFDPWLHLSCRSFIQTASQKYERPLSVGEKLRQTLHRIMCGICRVQEWRLDQLRALALEVGRKAGDDTKAELSSEALHRMHAAMVRATQEPGGGSKS